MSGRRDRRAERDLASGTASGNQLRRTGRLRLASDVQVLIGVGSLLALLAVAVGVAVFLIVSLEDNATNLSNRHVQYATAIHEAALSAKGMANDQRGFLLSGNTEFLAELEVRTAEARSAFDSASGNAVEASEVEAAAQARSEFERWLRGPARRHRGISAGRA